MNEESPELLYLPSDFLPTKKKQIDTNHGNKIWSYAVHFDRSLPEKDPNDSQMESFLRRINMLYEEVSDNLTKCLLSHLKVGCNFLRSALYNSHYYTLVIGIQTRAKFYNLNVEGSSIESIHTAVLSSSHILDDNYLVQVLDIMKHPHKKERAWFD